MNILTNDPVRLVELLNSSNGFGGIIPDHAVLQFYTTEDPETLGIREEDLGYPVQQWSPGNETEDWVAFVLPESDNSLAFFVKSGAGLLITTYMVVNTSPPVLAPVLFDGDPSSIVFCMGLLKSMLKILDSGVGADREAFLVPALESLDSIYSVFKAKMEEVIQEELQKKLEDVFEKD